MKKKDVYIKKEKYKPINNQINEFVEKILKNDFSGLKQSIKDRIRYGYEFVLQKRLEHLLCENLNKFQNIILFFIPNQDMQDFISSIKATRNYNTHFTKALEKRAVKGKNLYPYIEALKVIMQICFLIELEFPEDKIKKVIKRSRGYNIIKQRKDKE